MKKWITPTLLALLLLGSTMAPPAQAWPWNKKDKDKEAVEETQTGAEELSTDTGQSKEKSSGKGKVGMESALPVETPQPATPRVQVKSPLSDEVNSLKVEDPIESPELPPEKMFVAIDDPKNPLGVTTSAQKLNDCAQLISQKKYAEAAAILTPLKDWLIDATEAHINLHKTLKAIPSAQVQAELEKQLALQFALLRDKSFFQLGMLSIAQSDYSGAIKNLSRVIQSQPRSPMGVQAYEVLQKIGFTEKLQLREDKKPDQQAVTP